jgi:ComF family protein
VLDHLLDALFPRTCIGCGGGPWPLCDACGSDVVELVPPWCARCGSPASGAGEACADCPPEPIALARAPFLFDGPIRRAVHRLKFSGWRAVADALGEAMALAWRSEPEGSGVGVVTWVPLSRERAARRGFDQARALALVVGARLDLPTAGLLRRTGDPGPQARRGREERRAAMAGRFSSRTRASGRVLLVDDVLTTGATAGSCAQALLDGGAERVVVLTAARSLSGAPTRSGPSRAYTRGGLAPGSVVAPGNRSPAVDASRGRNDPRKATLGR